MYAPSRQSSSILDCSTTFSDPSEPELLSGRAIGREAPICPPIAPLRVLARFLLPPRMSVWTVPIPPRAMLTVTPLGGPCPRGRMHPHGDTQGHTVKQGARTGGDARQAQVGKDSRAPDFRKLADITGVRTLGSLHSPGIGHARNHVGELDLDAESELQLFEAEYTARLY